MAKIDPNILAHLEWIGFVRPAGLVVSAPALVRAGAILDRRDAAGQQALQTCVEEREFNPNEGPVPCISDFRSFAEKVLEWSFSPMAYSGTDENPVPPELEIPLPDYGETLRPDFAVRELEPKDGASQWQLLVRVLPSGDDFDRVTRGNGQLEASAHGRMERLLRQTGVSAGLLFNGRALRVVSAPRGESSGWLDFLVTDMVQVAGRPISTAMRLLLKEERLLALPRSERLAALLEDSRKFQNEVSARLAEQVLHALYELLRGFQAAHDASKGELLSEVLSDDPDLVYRALLTVMLRCVFLLYAEERDMLPEDDTFLQHYSLASLYERLREDAALFPDTMDQRYGAWAQLLVLFRMMYDGAETATMHLPVRHGVLFDPDRFPFLEGRRAVGGRQTDERIEPPLVPDGTIYRALEDLLLLDGERISYRALDVEQIGSVYQTMMGFRLETTTGRSVAIKAQKKHGAPTAVDLEALVQEPPTKRDKWLQDRADRKLSEGVKKAVSSAADVGQLHAALQPVIDGAATPDLVPKGAMVLQPSEERRRSGSHYTPRELTEPIVRTTLEPILARLRGEDGGPPPPEQILDLKVCDPALGSGAFLVEACRQLGDALVEAWHTHDQVPTIPLDEDEVVFARRMIAQRCLYGVDRNPIAVDLAKVSLWLITLAKDHAFTFLDHALRHGDSLVGLSCKQIEAFHWDPDSPRFQRGFEVMHVRGHVASAAELRRQIREAGDTSTDREMRNLLVAADAELSKVRLFGDLVVAAFFREEKPKDREARRRDYAQAVVTGTVENYRSGLNEWRHADHPLAPFHWEIEFPEVFGREDPGFDAIVGNPPFMGGTHIWASLGGAYRDFLKSAHVGTGGKAVDLVAHFFRQAFILIRENGTFTFIATNTIAQGDTRQAGLGHICTQGGRIYSAAKRMSWPGEAAVIVSVVSVAKGRRELKPVLDGKPARGINSHLIAADAEVDPRPLIVNNGKSFLGHKVLGMGFVFDDNDSESQASPTQTMRDILRRNPGSAKLIQPYIGGAEINTSPTHTPHRFAINFADMPLSDAEHWPELLALVRERVLPERAKLGGYSVADNRRERWWQYGTYAAALQAALLRLPRFLARSRISAMHAVCFLPSSVLVTDGVIAFAFATDSAFAVLQSQSHEHWARFFASSMKDDVRYTPSDCFDTFPFPEGLENNLELEAAGRTYYEFRALLMSKNGEGMTKTYNRFHDPEERDPDIQKLRERHAAMDRAVLGAYGWTDVPTDCEFLLDYEIDEDEWGNKKKPYRYRWPNDVRDQVLARLLELNGQRAAEEARSGAVASGKKSKSPAKTATASTTKDMFE